MLHAPLCRKVGDSSATSEYLNQFDARADVLSDDSRCGRTPVGSHLRITPAEARVRS